MEREIKFRLCEIRNKIHKDVLDLCSMRMSDKYTIEETGYRITIETK